jgi:hypothetical protein
MVGQHQVLTAQLLVHLGEVDSRGLYREHAFASMFVYAVEELHMSEAEAYLRIQAARLGRQYPIIIRMLAAGELHLTAIKLLGPHLTPRNHAQVLERAKFKGKREIELIVAELDPKPDVPSVVRKLPSPAVGAPADRATNPAPAPQERHVVQTAECAGQPLQTEIAPRAIDSAQLERTLSPPIVPSGTAEESNREPFELKSQPKSFSSVTPLSPGRYKIKFTAGQVMRDTLERLQDLMRHQVPDGDVAIILERAAKLLLEKTLKERFARTSTPRPRAINLAAAPTEARPRLNTPQRRVRGANVQPTRQHEPAHPLRNAIASAERAPQTRSRGDGPAPDAIALSAQPSEPHPRSVAPSTHPEAPHARSEPSDVSPICSPTHRPESRTQSDTGPQHAVSSIAQLRQAHSPALEAGPGAIASSTHAAEPHSRLEATQPKSRAQMTERPRRNLDYKPPIALRAQRALGRNYRVTSHAPWFAKYTRVTANSARS